MTGKVTEVSGSTYEGDYVRGKRDGFGIQTSISGNIYEGNWFNDKKHGDGHIFYAANSNNIIGTWSSDRLLSKEKEWKGDRNSEQIGNNIDCNKDKITNVIDKVKDIVINDNTKDNNNDDEYKYDNNFDNENNDQ
jgi:hypothetical protein